MKKAFSKDWVEKLGRIVGTVYGRVELIANSMRPRSFSDEDYPILFYFVTEQLPRYLNGKTLLPSMKYKLSIGPGGALLEMRRSKKIWHLKLGCRVFRNQRDAAWEILGHSAESDAIRPLANKEDGYAMRQNKFYLCRTAEGRITFVEVDQDKPYWRKEGMIMCQMPETASFGFELSNLVEGELIACPVERCLVKRHNGEFWTNEDPFGDENWVLMK